VNYGNIEDSGILYIPVMAKYYIADSGFSLQAGPQASILLEETGSDVNGLGLDLGFGASYDITENFFAEARYAFEITNRLTDEFTDANGDISSRINSLNIGIGYRF
jgi:opacity protein-like surface antigen